MLDLEAESGAWKTKLIDTLNDNFVKLLTQQEQNINSSRAQKHEELIAQLTRPKQIVRGADGRIEGIKSI